MLSTRIAAAALLVGVAAHDASLPINPLLGVPGFPHCKRQHPTLNLTVEEASRDLVCSQREAPSTAIKIGCVGDSITAGVCSSGGDHPYPQQLQKLLDAAHGPDAYSVTNIGECGSTMLKEGDSPFWQRAGYDTLKDNQWDIVTIMLGTNDAKDPGSHGPDNWQHDCGGADATTLQNCSYASDYHDMIELVKTLGTRPGVAPKIYVMVPPPLMAEFAYGMNQTVINSVYPQLVPLIAAANPAVTGVIDMFVPMGGEYQWKMDEAFPDGCAVESTADYPSCGYFCNGQSCDQCHPNDSGYQHMGNVLKSGLGL